MRSWPDVSSLSVRGHGEGTWQRVKDQRVQVRLMVDGRRHVRMIPRREADRLTPKQLTKRVSALLDEMREAADAGLVAHSSRLTLAGYLRGWMDERAAASPTRRAHRGRGRMRPSAERSATMIVERHIIPTLGHLPLARVSRLAVQRWVDDMDAKSNTVRNRHATLRAAMNRAVTDGLLLRNPCLGVALPESDARAVPTLTADQARALLDGTRKDRLHALWALALATGLRVSELLGLSWDDWSGDTLTVRSQLIRIPGKRGSGVPGTWRLADPKAARRREAISLPPFAVRALRAHKVRMGAERRPETPYHGLIFITPRGMPYVEQVVLRELYATEKRLGLPRVWVHGLRHTSATLLLDSGISKEVRMARLGHSTEEMARRYAHVTDAADRGAAQAIERAVGGKQ